MFLARREFGKVARVYEIRGDWVYGWPTEWAFSGLRSDGSKVNICDPGHCAVGPTYADALRRLHENDERAHEAAYGG